MKKILLLVATTGITLFACNNKSEKNEAKIEKADSAGTSSQNTPDSSRLALDHTVLIGFIPKAIEGYKAIGYPDLNDKYDGLATGETRSPVTVPAFLSFAKQQFEKGATRAEITYSDYRVAPEELNAFKKLYVIDTVIGDGFQISKTMDFGFPNVEAGMNIFPGEKKAELHIFICNRFLVDLRVVETADPEKEIRRIAKTLPLTDLQNQYCNQ